MWLLYTLIVYSCVCVSVTIEEGQCSKYWSRPTLTNRTPTKDTHNTLIGFRAQTHTYYSNNQQGGNNIST